MQFDIVHLGESLKYRGYNVFRSKLKSGLGVFYVSYYQDIVLVIYY